MFDPVGNLKNYSGIMKKNVILVIEDEPQIRKDVYKRQGSVVLLEAMFAGPICGASMNPIRSLSPAVVSGHLEHLWVYLTAPTLGAVLAVWVWKVLKPELEHH